ncbi:MAG: dynamin [Oscillochloris sp.]|nr:dynamin [Oscillochloris sp.]
MVAQGLFRRKRLITERQAALLAELRTIIERLASALERFGPDTDPADERTISETLAGLEELFLIVVAGEFNAGKSSFLNALLGEAVLPEGVTPTTDTITILRHGDEVGNALLSSGLRSFTHPADVLRQLVIVDTPGTNAVIRQHEELTRNFIPRADLVLFVTSADRPFTESERSFLTLIKEWGKKIVFILNKIDILEPDEREQVVDYIRDNAHTLLSSAPEIFAVSARKAIRARRAEGDEQNQLWEESLFGGVERYIVETLDEETRVRLKLLSPLGVARRLSDKYLAATEVRLDTLREDLATIDNIEQQLVMFKEDLANDVRYYLGEIDQTFRDLQDRGDQFFEETIRISRLRDLMNGDKLRGNFEREVVADFASQLDQKVQTLIDWMVEKNLRLQQSTDEYIKRRASQHHDKLIGSVGGSFDYNRRALIDSVGRAANDIIKSYDKTRESQQLADEVRASIAATAIVEVGAVGLGAALVGLFSAAWLDVTGVLLGTMLAVGGFALLPAKRSQARKALRARISEMREQLQAGVERQFNREVEQSIAQVNERNAPFTRFVRSQRGQLSELQRQLSDIDVDLARLKKEIDG